MNLRQLSQRTNKLLLALLLTILFIISPTNADGDKYYGAFVGNFVDRFHGIKGEVRMYLCNYSWENKIKLVKYLLHQSLI